ncbi:phosphate/phosphite/phosphonate ABC transporter substrate-binding protein [Vibrio sp. JPW-9-11-11]|uniref:phosphate/phosphite/phosphonate ABC transporter substrate-binding protein n=1 Tax=Vibrio sp. JPW-9-11-11 TaxID=1416532 RepID=UPI001594BB78|nr:phosphate/phosphite/phosphonate ABC transporter substrate-binding protein [Vibrio sp. JPW-9-11-11]NVD06710.1 phosphate/phosphite/phosphonate ABC transporter substrate-binding protein [Vibrio sp. JPW-9-11-11]
MKLILIGLLALIWGLPVSAQSLVFGVVPQQSASRLAQQWVPIMAHLSEVTGLEIEFQTAADIPTFEQRLARGTYDIAYMNPYHYTVYSQAPGYRAIAKARDKTIKGIIVTQRSNPSDSIQTLNNQTLAFPSPAAFAATILTQADLKNAGVRVQSDYVSSHDSVYLSVAKGFYPAGGGVLRTFTALTEEVKSQLKILHTTQSYTPHAIASHPRLNQKQVDLLRNALTGLDSSPQGQALLNPLKIKGFQSALDGDWDDVRQLDIRVLAP